MRRQLTAALGAAALVLTGAVSTGSPASAAAKPHAPNLYTDGVYIVQMIADPAASYTGGRAGLKATKPAAGKKATSRWPRPA